MTIKEITYSIQKRLQSHAGKHFKRAHIYEMMAASFGFNSYAAFSSKAVFTLGQTDAKPASQYEFAVRQRCIDMGYPQATAKIASSELANIVADFKLDLISLTELVRKLRGELSNLDAAVDDQKGAIDYGRLVSNSELAPPILIEGLEAAAGKGIASAHYALALIYAPNTDDSEQGSGSSYWHTQEQQGHVLTGVEKEWSDAHAVHLVIAEKHIHHLQEAAHLGNKYALLDMAEQFNDPAFFQDVEDFVDDDPIKIAGIAERLGRVDDARHWLTIAAEAGDANAMRQLIEGYDSGDLQRCWKWLYFSRLVGNDLTQSNHYAIHDDGTDYDYDVGGAAFVVGDNGVELTALDKEQDLIAQLAAQELFERSLPVG